MRNIFIIKPSFILLLIFLLFSCDLFVKQNPEDLVNNSKNQSNNPNTPINIQGRPGIVYVSNFGDGTVTYFNATTGGYLNGSQGNSTFSAGAAGDPYNIAVNPLANILYIINYNSSTVTYFNATTGAYLNGSQVNSTSDKLSTGPLQNLYGVAVNPSANILYVTNAGSSKVIYLNAKTVAYLNGTLANSSFTTGAQPYGVAVNPLANILYVANSSDGTVTYFNATSGAYLNGTLANSSFATGGSPQEGISVNPSANILYVANQSGDTVTYLNATTGAILGNYTTGVGPSAVAVNPSENILYVVNRDDMPPSVTYFNAATGAYLNGNFANSSFPTPGPTPNGVAVNPSANILYVVNSNINPGTVRYYNATTGAILGDQPTGSSSHGIAVNP